LQARFSVGGLQRKESFAFEQDTDGLSQFGIVIDEKDGLGGRQELSLSSQDWRGEEPVGGGFLQKIYMVS
jgi:hypothetical protein